MINNNSLSKNYFHRNFRLIYSISITRQILQANMVNNWIDLRVCFKQTLTKIGQCWKKKNKEKTSNIDQFWSMFDEF